MLFQRLRGNRRDFLPWGTALDQYANARCVVFCQWCGLSVLTPCLLSLCAVSAWACLSVMGARSGQVLSRLHQNAKLVCECELAFRS